MGATYGHRMLVKAEARALRLAARRRALRLLLPANVVVLWSLTQHVGARHARLEALGAGLLEHASDHAQLIGWTVVFVLFPVAASVKVDPLPAGAALAFLTGPVLSPLLFGSGGWRLWQTLTFALVTVLVLSAHRARASLLRRRLPR